MSRLHHYSYNKKGTDYICSDIHGHFFLLEEKLASVNFDRSVDRLFCLGDLIDRSDDSVLVLDYLKQPWFYSIIGNHEAMLIGVCENGDPGARQQWHFWGGDWAEDLSDKELDRYFQVISKLPVAIELELKSGKKVGLIHANLPDQADWHEVINALALLPDEGLGTYPPLLHSMLWEKAPVYDNYSINIESVKNISHIFHGHTIVNDIILLENRTFMDLGSYMHLKIGFIQPDAYLEKISGSPEQIDRKDR